MKYIVLEVRHHHTKAWSAGGHMTRDCYIGSLSSHPATGREVYLFGWINGQPGVWRSEGGADVAIDVRRVVLTDGLIPLSDLKEPFHLKIFRPDSTPTYLRISLSDTFPGGSRLAPTAPAEEKERVQ